METASVLAYSNVVLVREESGPLVPLLTQFLTVPVQPVPEAVFDRRLRGGVYKIEGEGEEACLFVSFDKAQPELFCFCWDGSRPGLVWYASGEAEELSPAGQLCSILAGFSCFKPNVRWTLYKHSGMAADTVFHRIGHYRTPVVTLPYGFDAGDPALSREISDNNNNNDKENEDGA